MHNEVTDPKTTEHERLDPVTGSKSPCTLQDTLQGAFFTLQSAGKKGETPNENGEYSPCLR